MNLYRSNYQSHFYFILLLAIQYLVSIIFIGEIQVWYILIAYIINAVWIRGIYIVITYNGPSNEAFSGSVTIAEISFNTLGNIGDYSVLDYNEAQINANSAFHSSVDGYVEIIFEDLSSLVNRSG